MNTRFYILVTLFLGLLALFCLEEFAVHSSVGQISSNRLISKENMAGYPSKVVLVVIDSLRYDYLQKIPFFQSIRKRQEKKSFIVKCMVGNPTMTTQRVESLMTGSQIFSSANIFKSFFASKLSMDNIISQLNLHNKTSIIFGDDTWAKLFDFTAEKTCVDTYNVHDYDSCDKIIYNNMIGRMKQETYDFMVAHFLALDHIGHSKGNIGEEIMLEKMAKISEFIEEIVKQMNNETILLVTGDHGMRNDGNHGGSSQEEVQTILFGYNKQSEFLQSSKETIEQSDITTILSIYLGVPLPSNAVGVPYCGALPGTQSQQAKMELLGHLLQHVRLLFREYKITAKYMDRSQQQIRQKNIQEGLQVVRKYYKQLQFLKYSTPNQVYNIAVLVLLTVVSAIIIFNILQQMQAKLPRSIQSLNGLLYYSNAALLSFTLFSTYFSWGLTQRMSIIFIVVVFSSLLLYFMQAKIMKKGVKLMILLCCVMAMCQTEPDKIGQYVKNPLCIPILHDILKQIPAKIIVYCLLILRIWSIQKSIVFYMVFLSANEFIFSCFQIPLYYVRAAVIWSNIYAIFNFIYYSQKYSKYQAILSMTALMLMFLGDFGPLIILCSIEIVSIAIELNMTPLFLSFYGEMVWWFMGNRFEYSGIDVVKSYVLSRDYSPFLNGFSMFFYLIAPQLTIFTLMNLCKMEDKPTQTASVAHQSSFQVLTQDETFEVISSIKCNEYALDKKEMLLANSQFIVIPLLGLLSCVWSVFYNNQKILFTVLYIPMFLLCIIKIISTFLMISLANNIINKEQERNGRSRL